MFWNTPNARIGTGHDLQVLISGGEERQGVQRRMDRLLAVVEQGIGMDTVLPRLRNLERGWENYAQEVRRLENAGHDRREVFDAAVEAAKCILSFDKGFERGLLTEKKFWLKQIVEGILVDRDKDVVYCTLSRLPKTENPVLKRIRDGVVQSSACPEQDLNLHDLAITSS